jgi:acetyltransferase-like isoleucine patch superfamily enzyme
MIGHNVSIFPNVHIGANVRIMDNTLIGKLPMTNRNNNRKVATTYLPTIIEDGVTIGANCVIYCGAHIRRNVIIHDLSSIREGCDISEEVMIGRGVMMSYEAKVGARTRIMDLCHVGAQVQIEEDCYLAICVCTTQDENIYLSRFGLAPTKWNAPIIRKKALIGANATILEGIEIGEGAVVASGAVATKNVAPYTVVAGVPAKLLKEISPADREAVEKVRWLR